MRRKTVIFSICAALTLGLLAFAACFFGYPSYQGWQADRAVKSAKASLEKRDFRSVFLSLQTALRKRPDHIEARQLAASLLEAAGSAEALLHRRRLMELQPELLAPKLALASTALRLGRPNEAAEVLNGIRGSDRQTREFEELDSQVALALGRVDLAAEAYRETLERDPENRRARVNLAILNLQSDSEKDRVAARVILESMTSDGDFGLVALRALARDSLRREDFPTALSWSQRLLETGSAEFADKTLRLQALFVTKSPEYDRWLLDLEKSASDNPRFAFELGKWKVTAIGPQFAASWLESLPKATQNQLQISVLLADCYSTLGRWNDLDALVQRGNWRELEALRLAFLARAQLRQNSLWTSERSWQLALKAAEGHPKHLAVLLAMARSDKRDVKQILWMIAEKDPRPVLARRELYENYRQERDAEGMLRVMELVLKENPNDKIAKYNVAGLLLIVGHQIVRAGGLARELYEEDSESLEKAALYAFSLHLQGESSRAAEILDSRKDLEKLSNDAAAYYALVLSGCGRGNEARRILAGIDRNALLPELSAALDRDVGSVKTAVNPASNQARLEDH